MVKAPFYDKNGVKKGAWSQEEDDKLRAYVHRHGHCNWRELPKFAGLPRCGKSCRLRWMNYLRPDVKHGNYTEEEDKIITILHEQLGNKWSLIAANLPGRTDNEVKNYWHTHLKKLPKKNPTSDDQMIKEPSDDHTFQFCSTDQGNKIIKCEADRSSTVVSNMNYITTPLHPILESSPLSPETSNSSGLMISSTSSGSDNQDHSPMSCRNLWLTEDYHSVASSDHNNCHQAFEETSCSGDFWTEPFVADSTYNHEIYSNPSISLAKGGFLLLCDLYYDDGMDLFYQVMQ